jgi:uncharacterized membrane protein HdeD (DUF308 family)
MLAQMASNWWAVALRGVIAILLGVLIILMPGIALESLIILLGAYFVVDGVGSVITSVRNRAGNKDWWIGLLEGIVSILAGIAAFVWPGRTALILLYIIGAWAIVTGVFEIWAAIRLRKEIENEWMLGLAGVLSIVFGILTFIFPGATALTLLSFIAVYAIIFGVVLLVLAFRLRKMNTQLPTSGPAASRPA